MDDRCDSKTDNEDIRDTGGLRTVIIQQGENGYGLTVSGENPVNVQDVKEGGPAALAGVKKGDALIRVNDTPVSKFNHKDVVTIIKSTSRVKLTLKSRDSDSQNNESFKLHHSGNKSGDLITAPLPINLQLQNQLEGNKVKMLHVFLEKEKKVRDNILAELQKNPSKMMQKNLSKELESVNRQISKILDELNMKDVDNQSNSSGSDSSNRNLSHHRVKSSPDPLGLQSSPGSNRLSGSDSVGDLSNWNKLSSVINEDEPPGTPPPPYGSSSTNISQSENPTDENYCSVNDEVSPITRDSWASGILTMEDEDGDVCVEDHGPFQSLTKLISMKYNAYMAVFVNYVISNCDPSSLFFYMITDLYKEGGVKEMKKWAYELHSSFLLPGAPMKLNNVDESVLYEIDETLQYSLDKEEILRRVFWKARQRSREDLNEQLADFRSKRSAGLGTLFGPADHILEETINNKCRELAVVENLLVPCLDSVSEDLKNQTERMLVMASSLATILWKYFNVRSQQAQQLLDRCPLFVNKDRPLRSKILRGSKKHVVRDHHFTLMTFYSVNHCNHCGTIIWGVAPQGYQCTDCEMNIHKSCVKSVEEVCVGQVHRNEKGKDTRLSSLLLKIMPDERDRARKSSHINAAQIERARRGLEDGDIFGHLVESDVMLGEKVGVGISAKEQRRSDPGGGGSCGSSQSGSALTNHQTPSNGAPGEDDQQQPIAPTDDADHGLVDSQNYTSVDTPANNFSKSQNSHKKRSGSNINRSESCKEKQHVRKQARENRKNSDPNIPTSKPGDVDGETPLSFHSGSSSNSSLSQSQESPPGNSAEQVEAYASALDNDSDIEADATLPDWTQRLSPEVVERLSSKDRKRHDTINELFHTEQSHVRVLKVLQFLFHQPLRQCGYVSQELLDRLFPNLDQMLKFHTSFNKAMKKRRQESPLVTTVGDILSIMFDGEEGTQFQQAAAEFVACQSFALESLKQQQKRDQKLAVFLQDQENHPHCRRLQLKDMLPAGFQRLSKYPLLLESLQSFTDKNKQPEEYEQIAKALERSKEILAYVNAAVQDAENHKRLREIQKKLDQSSMVKNKHANCEELRGELDLTKHKLIYEGPLTWKTSRGQKNIDLHVLILEDCVVLLQKDNDKYVLKYHSMNKSLGKDDNKLNLSPIIKFGTFLCREVATDKCGIFIILTQSTLSAQIYELVTSSPMERSMWLRHLHDAQASYNAREGRNRRPHPTPHIPDSEENAPSTDLRDVEDGVDADNSESVEGANEGSLSRSKQENIDGSFNSNLTTPQASSSPDSLAKKTESEVPPNSSSVPVGTGSPPQTNPSGVTPRRRLQEVQIIQIVEGPSLIQPSEVKVSQGVVLSAEPVLTPIELLRRKDLKIRQELEEKQTLIADILNIPHQDFESVADMAGEVGLSNQEPRELVLGAIYQAKKLQEALNEAQSIRDSDIIAAQACSDSVSKTSIPFCHTTLETMEKLNNITGTITQFLNSLMVLISERDDERERMRKELVASRERIHQLHMHQQTILQEQTSSSESQTQGSQSTLSSSSSIITTTVVSPSIDLVTPHSSRPSSFVSANSSGAEQSELTDQQTTDEEGRSEDVSSAEVQSQSWLSTERNEGESTGSFSSSALGEKTGTNLGVSSIMPSKEQQSEASST